MRKQYERTCLLIGQEAVSRLRNSSVAVFGIGGVGGHAVDALVRSGVGRIALFDSDTVTESNINRQLIASYRTIGRLKVEAMREHLAEIAPDVAVETNPVFYLPENADNYDLSRYDYIVDAVDTVSAKLEIITRAKEAGVPVISSMGAGNKLDPTAFEVTDIYKTSVCPLARVMRRELRNRGIDGLKVVYSRELPIGHSEQQPVRETSGKRQSPGSIAFVPAVAGLIIAEEVIKDIISAD